MNDKTYFVAASCYFHEGGESFEGCSRSIMESTNANVSISMGNCASQSIRGDGRGQEHAKALRLEMCFRR